MKASYILFLKRLYGDKFNREFARIGPKVKFDRIPCNNLELLLKNFKNYEKRECSVYATVYTFNPLNPITAHGRTYPYNNQVILDRIFIDFDKNLTNLAKKEYDRLISPESKQDFYSRLIEQGQAKLPITEAKKAYNFITEKFGGDPTLIFSGAKGCHMYIHFNPVKLQNPKETITYFVDTLERKLNLETSDPNVKADFSRLARIPTSKHPKTGLYSHPWKISYTYNQIIKNSNIVNVPFDDLDLEASKSNIENVLYRIDSELEKKKEILKYQNIFRKLERKPTLKVKNKIKIEHPQDILQLNQFPCFLNFKYTHDSRFILANICKWCGLSPEDTVEALRIFTQYHDCYDPNKHLHDIKQIKTLKKYVFTCNYMKKHDLCYYSSNKDKFCRKWFYRKLNFPDQFYQLLKCVK